MHGKRRRKSSCAPFKHNILEGTHPHNQDGSHPNEETTEPANTIAEAVADPNFDPSASSVRQATAYNTRPKQETKSVSGDDTLDNIQDALNYGGLAPGWGIIPDLFNVGISSGRALYGLATGDYEYAKKHGTEALIHTGSAVPLGIGQTITLGKRGIDLTKKVKKLDTDWVNVQKDRTIEAMQMLNDMGQPKKSKKQEVKYKPIVESPESSKKKKRNIIYIESPDF